MNTELLKKHCGIDIPDLNKRALRCEAMKIDTYKADRLMTWVKDHCRGFNWGIVKSIEAYRVTYKRKPLGIVKVVWSVSSCGMDKYFKEADYNAI